jgi:FHA domain-containing protein
MRFSIVKNKSGQVPPQSSCDFLPPGGTIGRSVDNNLVLPDEERAISRLQAIVHISADGECRVTNRGNVTRVLLNDIPLERGRQVELQDGDILGIDDYQIQVTSLQQAAAPQAQPAVKTADTAPVTTPVAKEKSAAPIPNEIWDSLVEEFTPAAAVNPRPAPVINQDSHPLLETPEPEMNPADPLAQLAGDVELRQLQSQQTDPAMLFNTDTTFERDPILADTTPSALLAEQRPTTSQAAPIKPAELEKNEQELDPLALFGGSSAPTSPDALNSNDPLGLLMGSAVPLAQPEPPAAVPQPAPPLQQPVMAAPVEAPQPKAAPQPVAQPEPMPQPEPQFSPSTPPPPPQPRPRPANRLGIDPIAYQTARAQNTSAPSGERLEGPLLAALLQGVGLDDLQPQPHFDEQQLRQAGRLLSLFSQGTVALLSSRSILKRGVKAEMTMILDEANNPFKLLPSGKTVLMQMFGSKMPGFMPPEQAVRDALIDLQAHQLGMIAGEIEDDFHTLFGEAFLHAYDVEVNQYKDSQTQPDA